MKEGKVDVTDEEDLIEETNSSSAQIKNDIIGQDSIADETNSSQVAHEHHDENDVDAVDPVSTTEKSFPGSKLPQYNKIVLGKLPDNGWRRLEIISRGGKATSKYSSYVIVYDVEEKQGKCIDWSNVEEWKEVAPEEIFSSSVDNPSVMKAKFQELEKWKEYNVYDGVEKSLFLFVRSAHLKRVTLKLLSSLKVSRTLIPMFELILPCVQK